MKTVRTLICALAASLACAASTFAIEAPVWQQFHGPDGGHSGASPVKLTPANITARWNADPAVLGTGNFFRAQTPCVSADGSIVVAYADNNPYTSGAGKLVAIDAFTGAAKWTLAVSAFNDFISNSSAVFHNGYFYWSGSNGAGVSKVYKINAQTGSTGAAQGGWVATLPDAVDIVNFTPTVTDTKVFVSSYGGFIANSRQYALNVADGTLAWSHADNGQGQGAYAYDAVRGLVYQTVVVGMVDKLRAYDAETGATIWTAPWDFSASAFQCGIALVNDKIYIQDNDFSTGSIYIADAANLGALIDQIPTPKDGSSCVTVDPSGNMYYYCDFESSGPPFFNPGDGKAVALNADGTDRWMAPFDLGGGAAGSAAWADGHVFVGQQNGDNLYILKDSDGSTVRTLVGSGPVAFGERTFFSIGNNGKLYAYSTGSDFASSVTSYTAGTGAGSYTVQASALGRPTVDTDPTTDFPVVPVSPAYQTSELLTVGVGGSVVLKFDHKILRDSNNPYGIDFVVFGNAFNSLVAGFWDKANNPNAVTVTTTPFNEPGKVSVSQDGTTWFPYTAPFADDHAPTLGRIYDPSNPAPVFMGNMYWGAPTDATLALNPAVTGASFAGKTLAQVAQAYGRSAGGTGFKLSDVGLDWIQYVKIEENGLGSPDIDAVSDARIANDTTAPGAVTGVTLSTTFTTAQLNWTNPSALDFAGVIVVRRQGQPLSAAPTASIGYYRSGSLGGGTVVYAGTGTSFNDTGLSNGTQYFYQLYAFDPMLNYSTAGGAAGATLNNPVVLVSPAGASATSVFVGTAVTFTAAASDADNDTLTYSWDFGDGTFAAGASVQHAYGAVGTYTATVTISDGKGSSVQSSVIVDVTFNPNDVDNDGTPNALDKDSDNDGFPNAIEIALGTDPLSAASTPLGGKNVGSPANASFIQKVQIKLNFSRANTDRITFGGGIPISGGIILSGQSVGVYAGGIGKTFVLDSKGVGGDRANNVKVRGKSNATGPQTISYNVTLSGDLKDALADEGLTGTADVKNQTRTVTFAIVFNGSYFQQNQVLRYTAKKGKSGSAR